MTAPETIMFNDRPIADPNLQRALDAIRRIMQRHNLAGACLLVSETEAAYTYKMHADWSAISADHTTPFGFRIRANAATDGLAQATRLIEGAAHTIYQIGDFGEQTGMWMGDLKTMLRNAGIDVEHKSFNGYPPPHIVPR
jgi:hypothetical protein